MTPRAPKAPGHAGPREPWSTRTRESIPGWSTIRRRILERDNGVCHVCGGDGADEVDHVTPVAEGGHPTDPANLGAIHSAPCHADKSKAERLRGSARRPSLRRPVERHPGLLP